MRSLWKQRCNWTGQPLEPSKEIKKRKVRDFKINRYKRVRYLRFLQSKFWPHLCKSEDIQNYSYENHQICYRSTFFFLFPILSCSQVDFNKIGKEINNTVNSGTPLSNQEIIDGLKKR